MTESFSDPTFLFSLGGGVLAGVAVGVALRSAVRLALLVVGVIILLMAGLVHQGIVTVDWGAVSSSLESGAQAAGGLVELAITDLSAQLAGFSAGVVLGFRFK